MRRKRLNILFTVCARAGSKGVKNKNIRMFCGKPLVYYTIAAFEDYKTKYRLADHVCLAINTDSGQLLRQADRIGVEYVAVERKKALAGDAVAKKDVIKDTVKEVERQGCIKYDTVVDLDLTSPLRTASDIDGTIRTLMEDEQADIAYSVTEARRSPYFNMVAKDVNGYYTTVTQTDYVTRQQAPECYDMNASIYAYRREYLLSERLNDRKALVWEMQDTGILDIDSEHDLKLMEVVAGYLFANAPEYTDLSERVAAYGN